MKKENKLPFGKVLVKTLKCCSSMADQWRIWLSYAFVMALISLVFRRWSYGCMEQNDHFWCVHVSGGITTGVVVKYLIYYILTLMVVFAYIHDYYQAAFCEKNFTLENIFVFKKAKIKSMLFLTLILFIFLVMGCTAYFLIRKPANPNWMIEFIYFVIVFFSFLIPLITIRLSAFISYYLQDGHMPDLIKIYKDTTKHSFIPLIMFFLAVVMIIILLLQSGLYLRALNLRFDNFAVVFLSEVAGYVIILMCYSLIIAVFRAQHEVLVEYSVSRETIIAEEAKEQTEEIKVEEKKAKKSTNSKGKKTKRAESSKTSKKRKTKKVKA